MQRHVRLSSALLLLLASCALPARVPPPGGGAPGGWSPATAALIAEPTELTAGERALGHFLKGQIALNQSN